MKLPSHFNNCEFSFHYYKTKKTTMSYRNLEAVRSIIKDATGLDVAYAYDDLVFLEHTAFIIRFDDKNRNNFFCYFHSDCNPNDKVEIYSQLTKTSILNKFTIENKGKFLFKQKGEEIEIHYSKSI